MKVLGNNVNARRDGTILLEARDGGLPLWSVSPPNVQPSIAILILQLEVAIYQHLPHQGSGLHLIVHLPREVCVAVS